MLTYDLNVSYRLFLHTCISYCKIMLIFIPLSCFSNQKTEKPLKSEPVVVHSLGHVQLCVTHGLPARQASLSFTIYWSLLKQMSTESMMPFDHLILCLPLLLLLLMFPSIKVFSNDSAFTLGGQSIQASVSALSMNIQDGFPLGLTGLSLCSPRDSQKSSPTPQFKSIKALVFSIL